MTRSDEWNAAYGTLGQMPQTQLMQLPLEVLDPWESPNGERQPFKMYAPEALDDLAQSIRERGIIEPICCRPKPNGRMEIIAGHNRVAAAKLAELRAVPAIVRQLDDASAAILLVDSNLKHRETLLPSEKAFAYKLRLDSLKRKAGRPKNNLSQIETNFGNDAENGRQLVAHFESDEENNGRQLVAHLKAADKVGEESGESGRTIQRYIRLTYLLPELLDMVDAGKPAVNAAVDLSYLSEEKQQLLLDIIKETEKIPNLAQSKAIRKAYFAGEINREEIMHILFPQKRVLPKAIQIPTDRLLDFFPADVSPDQITETLIVAMAEYKIRHKDKEINENG